MVTRYPKTEQRPTEHMGHYLYLCSLEIGGTGRLKREKLRESMAGTDR